MSVRRIADEKPRPHARYHVRRGDLLFTATPCYGMHVPWWVPRVPDQGDMPIETAPISMHDDDEWWPAATDQPSMQEAEATPAPSDLARSLRAIYPTYPMVMQAADELDQWRTWGVIEVAARNPNVASFVADGERLRIDAMLWRGLMASDRIRVMGSAGMPNGTAPGRDMHIGVEFWSDHPAKGDPKHPQEESRAQLTAYADALSTRLTSPMEDAPSVFLRIDGDNIASKLHFPNMSPAEAMAATIRMHAHLGQEIARAATDCPTHIRPIDEPHKFAAELFELANCLEPRPTLCGNCNPSWR